MKRPVCSAVRSFLRAVFVGARGNDTPLHEHVAAAAFA